MTLSRVTLLILSTVLFFSAAKSEPLKSEPLEFTGTLLNQVGPSEQSAVSFRSQGDPDFVETITIRSIVSNGNFNDVSQAFIARAKSESGGARLRVMEKLTTQELMVVYLKELQSNRIRYRVERLSAPKGLAPVSVAYSSEFEIGDTSDDQDLKIKTTAIEAIASFDMDRARKLLKAEH